MWGLQQNEIADSQLESAQATGLPAEHERRVAAFADAASDDRED